MKTTTSACLMIALAFSLRAQYCIPVSQGQFLEPIINGVSLGSIGNTDNGFPLEDIFYSDYTAQSTDLATGGSYSLAIDGGAAFQYNFAAWIDFDHDDEFDKEEKIGNTVTASNYPSVTIDFTVPEEAHNGLTRLRVRAGAEPYGSWVHPTDPCAPWQWGETEDYTVNISGGIDHDISLKSIEGPVSGINLSEESILLALRNSGIIPATNFPVSFSVNNGTVITEIFAGTLQPDSVAQFTFGSPFNFNDVACYEISAWVTWGEDESPGDDTLTTSICHTEPVAGGDAWYVQSNINGGLEPLGGPPYNSTTNRTCMNEVFGEGNWLEGSFEETDPDSIFSTASCLVFIDGSYEGEVRLQEYMAEHRHQIENWVASGGHLFLLNANDGSLSSNAHIFDLGFGGIKTIASFVISYGIPFDTLHPIFNEPYTPARKQWNAFYYAPSILFGSGFDTLIADNDDAHFLWNTLNLPLLIEKKWGNGMAIMGTISPSQLVSPENAAMNNRKNTLVYLHSCIATDADPVAGSNTLRLFPNPASDEVVIYHNPGTEATLKISDLSGKTMLEQRIANTSGGTTRINVAGLKTGIYLAEFLSGEERNVARLAVTR